MANDNWETQNYIYDWIQSQLKFQMILDLAANGLNSKCPFYIGELVNALTRDWNGWIDDYRLHRRLGEIGAFCNPPYSKPNLPRFTEKACLEAEKGLNQCFIVPLDITSWSRDYVWGQAEVWIPDERIAFINPDTGQIDGSPPKGSMIVIYGPLAVKGHIKSLHIPRPGEMVA